MLDHATSDVHKAAMARLRADSVRARGGTAVLGGFAIGHSLSTMDRETRASTNGTEVRTMLCNGEREHSIR